MPTIAMESKGVAIRDNVAKDVPSILRAILAAGDYGILLTALDHTSIACNRQFGEIFGLVPEEVVRMSVEELRDNVKHLIPDPKTWVTRLNEIYADPIRAYEDEVVLLKSPPITVRRYSGPVLNERGEIEGRLWTFRDITKEIRVRRMNEALHELGSFHNPDPMAVHKKALDLLADFYNTNAILSIRHGDYLEFRAVSGPPGLAHEMPGNEMENAYCRFAFASSGPFLLQDARCDPIYQGPASDAGFTRYLGVPINGPSGAMVGTVCLVDGRSDELLDDEDIRFVSYIAMRMTAEMSREQFIKERIAEQEAVVRKQRADLATTQEVLSAMNKSFELLGSSDADQLMAGQLKLLRGVLGYDSASILICDGEHDMKGWALGRKSRVPQRLALSRSEMPTMSRVLQDVTRYASSFHTLRDAECPVTQELGSTFVLAAPLMGDGRPLGLIALGRKDAPPIDDVHHATHLEALTEQVNLLVASFMFQTRLVATNEELKQTYQKLIESEKLSIVGTLAASVAHDIRNILASLAFELSASEDRPREALQAVKDQLDRFSALAHRLLSYARPRLIARESVSIDQILQRVVALTSAQANVSGVRVSTQLDAESHDILGEPHQLEHLFVNLIMNSLQAMTSTGGSLLIRSSGANGRLVIEVADSGKGIPDDVQSRLFEPFASTRPEGFGLGLFSCRRIVEDHQGQISVHSEAGRGATFTIVFERSTQHPGDTSRER